MATGDARWRLGRRPALDGLRGVAAAMVVIDHIGVPGTGLWGGIGVAVFFTLSGFLITTLILEEREETGRLRFGAFYLRRALRLMPALACCVLMGVVAMWWLPGAVDWKYALGSLSYVSNWLMAAGTWPAVSPLAHTWSLAIEEQFYLVWPVLLVFVVARLPQRARVGLVVTGCCLAVVWRLALAVFGDARWARLNFGFDTRVDGLLLGCALALALHRSQVRAVSPLWMLAGAFLLFEATRLGWMFVLFGPTLVGLGALALIWPSVTRGRVPVLDSHVLGYLGRRSYGIYLYQAPLLFIALKLFGEPSWWQLLPLLPVLLLVAEGSSRYVEQPILALRPSRRPGETVPRARQPVPHAWGTTPRVPTPHAHRQHLGPVLLTQEVTGALELRAAREPGAGGAADSR